MRYQLSTNATELLIGLSKQIFVLPVALCRGLIVQTQIIIISVGKEMSFKIISWFLVILERLCSEACFNVIERR